MGDKKGIAKRKWMKNKTRAMYKAGKGRVRINI
jgi:hypothetical protein